MFDFTNRVKKVINEYAPKEAKRLGHEFLGPEHILLGLLKATDSVAVKILQNLNINLSELKKEIEKRGEQDFPTLLVEPGVKDKVQKVLEYSREEARKLRHSYIGSEHILLALLRDPSSIVTSSLGSFSITYQVIRNELNQALGLPSSSNTRSNELKRENSKTPMLDEFARNLTNIASGKEMDPIIGRDKEIERVIQILSRKTKNNPILIGEAGVGKTAIVEGLAQRIVLHKVPETLFEKKVYALDVAALIAGTKYRGEFEDRIKKVMKEVKTDANVILFIDEVHTIIGAGAAEGAVDAANILKPTLARGEIQCIGATTFKEYKRYIERDSALERRFQNINVDEPSIEDTIRILSGLRKSYENHHGVVYTKESIKSAVRLSEKFITDRYLPDKAIDIIDEAGARARLKRSIIPDEIKNKENKISHMIIQKNEMVKLQEYEKAAKLRDQIVSLEKDVQNSIQEWRAKEKKCTISIQERDSIAVIADWTGIPLNQIHESEAQKLLKMEEELSERVVGQKNAIEKITSAVRRSRTGLKSSNRPIGSFIFLGPTGVGKTELAKALSDFLFADETALIRFDMSEYMEVHSVAKFIGSPPGYVGYEDGGQLTEKVRHRPYSVLLFDEIEKAHPEIQNILLQIIDEGFLTDTMGHRVDFKETMIILTSNIGARTLQKGGQMGFEESEKNRDSKNDQVMEELKKFFSPEFLNRIDELILFENLTPTQVSQIVNIMIEEINENLISRNIHIVLNKASIDYLAKKGYDEKYGARPLRRTIQKEIEDKLAILVLEGKLNKPSLVKVSVSKKNSLLFRINKLSEDKLTFFREKYLVAEESIDEYWDYEEPSEEQSELAST